MNIISVVIVSKHMTQKLFLRISQFGFGGQRCINTQQEHKKNIYFVVWLKEILHI